MKVIDEIIKCANGEPLFRKAKLENGVMFEYNGYSIVEQIIEKYGIHKDILNAKLEPIEEDAFEDIEETDVALLGQCDNWLRCPTNNVTKQDTELNPYIISNIRENTLEFQHKINELIRNQKKIISKLEGNK